MVANIMGQPETFVCIAADISIYRNHKNMWNNVCSPVCMRLAFMLRTCWTNETTRSRCTFSTNHTKLYSYWTYWTYYILKTSQSAQPLVWANIYHHPHGTHARVCAPGIRLWFCVAVVWKGEKLVLLTRTYTDTDDMKQTHLPPPLDSSTRSSSNRSSRSTAPHLRLCLRIWFV